MGKMKVLQVNKMNLILRKWILSKEVNRTNFQKEIWEFTSSQALFILLSFASFFFFPPFEKRNFYFFVLMFELARIVTSFTFNLLFTFWGWIILPQPERIEIFPSLQSYFFFWQYHVSFELYCKGLLFCKRPYLFLVGI